MSGAITTEHLNEALDLAAGFGLAAKDILRIEVEGDRLAAVVIIAATPAQPKVRFPVKLRPGRRAA